MFWWLLLFVRYSFGSLFILPLSILSKRLRERRVLEKDHGPKSFEYKEFPYWFHVSSEGELEQVLPLLRALNSRVKKKSILLLYTSQSLLNKVAKVRDELEHVEVCMVPLLKFFWGGKGSLFSFEDPELFFMVRYDFFPELLFKGKFSSRFILLSASLKGKMAAFKRNKMKKIYYSSILKSFDEVYAAGPKDRERISQFFSGNLPFTLYDHDFRHGQIIERQVNKKTYLDGHCEDSFNLWLGDTEINERIIFGSLWPNELEVFTEDFREELKKGSMRIFIAPHKLNGPEWEKIEENIEAWKDEGMGIVRWTKYGIQGEGPILLCEVPGLLCELYPFFGHAFVGGGHGRSVHSLLEPYWGGGHIYCGPKTHRSTEYDYVESQSPRHLHVVNELEGFYSKYKRAKETPLDFGVREKAREEILQKQKMTIEDFFGEHYASDKEGKQ